eukprot:TRINITY_DN906_c0_g1_i1.p1 TRINITY_DN906_c0_g1~~TRINITY_DN906_c0_g1_i1.p1  ORF type:complete len:224 (-),score=52.71 TRINITY_DN906_c0_g1_i1:40-615(-)
MFLVDWFWSTLSALGLWSKNAKIVFLGLDNAGKTTLLHLLKANRLGTHMPTQQPTMEELSLGNVKFRTFDLGGHQVARKIWREYYAAVDAVVFLVDSSAPDRFEESKVELEDLLASDDLKNVPFLVLGNKIDVPGAVDEQQMRAALDLQNTYGGRMSGGTKDDVRPIELFMCSLVKRQGYKEGFQWLSQFI